MVSGPSRDGGPEQLELVLNESFGPEWVQPIFSYNPIPSYLRAKAAVEAFEGKILETDIPSESGVVY